MEKSRRALAVSVTSLAGDIAAGIEVFVHNRVDAFLLLSALFM